jgi:hypothetical protein
LRIEVAPGPCLSLVNVLCALARSSLGKRIAVNDFSDYHALPLPWAGVEWASLGRKLEISQGEQLGAVSETAQEPCFLVLKFFLRKDAFLLELVEDEPKHRARADGLRVGRRNGSREQVARALRPRHVGTS